LRRKLVSVRDANCTIVPEAGGDAGHSSA
jgi:hypothetical protein